MLAELERAIAPRGDALLADCEHAQRQARLRGASHVRYSISAPHDLQLPTATLCWSPDATSDLRANGSVVALRAEGVERFSRIQTLGQKLFAGLFDPAPAPFRARLFGGFSFAATDAGPDWAAFGQAQFWLPRICYQSDRDGAMLSLCAPTDASAQAAAHELQSALSSLTKPPSLPHVAHLQRFEGDDDEAWISRIESIRAAIARGELQKLVASRTSRLTFDRVVEPESVLHHLASSFADCYRFAIAAAGSYFVGASPEMLIHKQGLEVRTQALAGSTTAPGDLAEAELRKSGKDRMEHELVVDAIASALAPLCRRLDYPHEPRVHSLPNISHLCTPFSGELALPRHVLELVEMLHPTPAVGGVPRAAALRLLSANEPQRGWYASPVGWFDATGDGHFAVAIRSALLIGSRALVFAGAGIVEDSDPRLETREVRLKQRAICDALGVEC